jgi:cation:H+ antiporter
LAVVGIALMGAGGWLAVLGAERVIDLLGVVGSVVGLTLVALATTSEFLALIPAALRRWIPELAAAGIVGSVIYNATVTLGVAAAAQPLDVAGLSPAAAAAVVLSAVISAVAWTRGRIGRPLGAALVTGYAVYVLLVWR